MADVVLALLAHAGTVIIEIEVRDPTRPAGTVTVDTGERQGAAPTPFLGWLELLGVLATLVEAPALEDVGEAQAETGS